MVHCYHVEKEKTHQNNVCLFFSFFDQLMRHSHIEIFHLSNLLKCQMTIECLMLSSLATSHVTVRGSALMITLSWLLSTFDGQLLFSSYSRLSSTLQNFLNHHCTVPLLAVPGPNVLLMFQVVSTSLGPILNLNKKITQISFFSNINFVIK